MRIIHNARFERRCKCGAKGVYSIAMAYADRVVTCRSCRRPSDIEADDMQTIDEHIARVIANVAKGVNGVTSQ